MDLSNLRGSPKGKKRESSKSARSSETGPEDNNERSDNNNHNQLAKPRDVTQTKAWQQSTGGLKQMWENYVSILATQFQRLDRPAQEQLIMRLCQVITVGCAIVLTNFFYQFIPLMIRVFAFPAILVGSWFVATKVVTPIVIAQFEDKLNK